MQSVIDILGTFLQIYILCVLAWVLISWLPMISPSIAYNDTLIKIRRFLDSIILPYVKLFKFIPPVRMGAAMLDLSALVAILVLQIGGYFILNLLSSLLTG